MVPEPAADARHHLGVVARGAGLGLVGSGVSALATFGLVIVVARVAGADDSGVFFAATAVFLILLGITSLGVDAGMARFGARLASRGEHEAVHLLFRHAGQVVTAVAVVVAALTFVLAGPLAGTLGWGADGDLVLRVVAAALPFAVLAEWAQAGTRAFGRMQETVWVDRTARPVLQVLGVGAAGALDAGATGLTVAWVSAYPLLALVSWRSARRDLRRRLSLSPGRTRVPVREFWAFTWPRAFSVVARMTVQKVDVVLVAALLTPAHAALYTVATRFVALGQAVSMALTQVLQARFAALLLERSHSALSQVYRISTAWSVLLSWPLYLAIAAAPAGYLALFGQEYVVADGERVVVAMAAAMLLASATGPVDVLLVMAGRSVASMVNAWVALAVDVLLCLLLIPWVGVAGAALAWAAAVLVKTILAVAQVRAEVRVSSFSPLVGGAAALAVGTVALPVWLLDLSGTPWPLAVALAGLCCGCAMMVWRRPLRLDLLVSAIARRTDVGGGRG